MNHSPSILFLVLTQTGHAQKLPELSSDDKTFSINFLLVLWSLVNLVQVFMHCTNGRLEGQGSSHLPLLLNSANSQPCCIRAWVCTYFTTISNFYRKPRCAQVDQFTCHWSFECVKVVDSHQDQFPSTSQLKHLITAIVFSSSSGSWRSLMPYSLAFL